MAQEYVKYKLHEAVEALAASASPIQRRLFNAWLILHSSKADDFDNAADGQRFAAVMDALTAREATADEGAAQTTTSHLTDDEAEAIAKQIVELDTVCRPLFA
jgi:hypothetical protein